MPDPFSSNVQTKAQVAAHLDCSTAHVDRLVASGRLKRYMLDQRTTVYDKAEVEALRERLTHR